MQRDPLVLGNCRRPNLPAAIDVAGRIIGRSAFAEHHRHVSRHFCFLLSRILGIRWHMVPSQEVKILISAFASSFEQIDGMRTGLSSTHGIGQDHTIAYWMKLA